MEIRENHSLRNLNTFGIDVSAHWFAELTNIPDLQALLSDNRFQSLPKLILGGGSNILFTGDFKGLVIHNRIDDVKIISEDANYALIKAGAGMIWHALVLFTIENNFPGLENLSLIPGCVGAAPIQNIGAYGVEMKNTLHELSAVNLSDGSIKIFNSDECMFGYRDSIFKHAAKGKYMIVDVTFRLDKNSPVNTSYGAITEQLKKINVSNPTIRDVSNAVIAIRQSKLPDPAVIGNAGSFFKNPEIDSASYNELKINFPGIVGYSSGENKTKLAAGWLIEQCGWKGKRNGNTGMHEKQALVLVNHGGATGKELLEHAQLVQSSVFEKFNVELEMEVNIF